MEERKKMKTLITLIAMVFLVGCGAPALSSSMRTNFAGDEPIITRCHERTSTFKERGNVLAELEAVAKANWKLSYISEYKGSMRRKYVIMYCAERTLDTTKKE